MSYQTEGDGSLFKITAHGVVDISALGEVRVTRAETLVMKYRISANGGMMVWPSSLATTNHELVVYFTQNQPLTFDCTPNIEASFFCVDDKEHVYLVAMPKGIKVYPNADHDYANRGQNGEI